MGTGVKTKYNVAINSKGYMFRGAPDKASYSKAILPSQVSRMSVSDLAYSDFSGQGLFYLAQTDWSAGIKSEVSWRDDAKFYYSTNIDAYSDPGSLKLELEVESMHDFSEAIVCGTAGSVGSNEAEFVGCEQDGSSYVKIYRYFSSSWSDIAGTDFGTAPNICSDIICHKELLWAFTVGAGNTGVVMSWDGSSWTDHSADIIAASTYTAMSSARCACQYADVLYTIGDSYSNSKVFLMSTADNGTTWTEEVYFDNTSDLPVSMCGFNSKIYYLMLGSNILKLRCFDPSDSTDILVREFPGASVGTWGEGKLLKVFQNKLIITIPSKKIYSLDTSGNFIEIYTRDDAKYAISSSLAEATLTYGSVEYNDRLYWGNLIWDGEAFFNHKRPASDGSSANLFPCYVTSSNAIRYTDNVDTSVIYKNATTYKTTIANNYAVLNEMSPVGAIDKLLDSVTILFKKMSTGQSIKIQYSIDEMSTWVDVGTRSYSSGDSTTKKTFRIPGNVIFNKIYFKILLDGSATSAVLTDLIMAYRPMPDFKNYWEMLLNLSAVVLLLNTQSDSRNGYEINAELWNEKASKQKVIFEDVDYVECNLVSGMTSAATSALVSSTKRFPRQGRIRAVSGSIAEEMTYTSALSNRLLGISRARRGTVARAYSSGQQLDSGYDVYVDDIISKVNFTDEKKNEFIAQVTLIEA